ncbi:hypothetical protein ANTPLA_LOCUS10035 [Anthophora plagiata]
MSPNHYSSKVEAFASRWQHYLREASYVISCLRMVGEAVWRRSVRTVDCTTLQWFSAACNFALERPTFNGLL